MKFLDLFSGIGGFRFGLERAGHDCFGFCEFDKYARASYKAIHNTEGEVELHDITTIPDDYFRLLRGKIDIITGGFPCQSFSIAGKRQGFEDKTKGTLFFDIARAAKQIQPQFLFLENVKGLLNHDKGNTFRTILSTLDELGYDAEWQLLNSKDFGVPQNRERVFIIGHLRNGRGREVFPIEGSYGQVNKNDIKAVNDSKKIREQIGFESVNRFYDIEGISPCLNTMSGGGREPKIMVVGNTSKTGHGSGNVLDEKGLCTTILSRDYKGPKQVLVREATKQGYAIAELGDSINFEHPNSKTRRGRVGKGVANTLTTSCNQGTLDNFRIRKLTPLECWRLQGFPDSAFRAAEKVNSNSQLYKQAGNSVTVNVIYEIAKRLI